MTRPSRTYPARPCKNCSTVFAPKRGDAKFCGDICRCRSNNARMLQGALIYDLALYWRSSRDKSALSDLCFIVDRELAGLKAAGKPKPSRPQIIRSKAYVGWTPDGRMPRQAILPK